MIRFWITKIWEHEGIRGCETVMRIDSDSCFVGAGEEIGLRSAQTVYRANEVRACED